MIATVKATAPCALLLLVTSLSLSRQQKTDPTPPEESCRAFVQDFYNWYSQKAADETTNAAALAVALKDRSSDFTPELLQALKDELAAEKKDDGDVWIDFDVFLNSPDIADRYEAAIASRRDKTYWVEVYGTWSGKKRSKPDVVAELDFKHGQWTFVNFHYGERKGQDLLNALRSVREDRQEHSH